MSLESQRIHQALLRTLKPLIRLLYRFRISYGVFAEAARYVYVDTARKELLKEGKKASNSRISVVTGIPRNEITRLSEQGNLESGTNVNRAGRVVSGWVTEKEYQDPKTGKPRDLPVEGASPSLEELVKNHSGGIPLKALLAELLDSGCVRKVEDGVVRLVLFGYLPKTDLVVKLEQVTEDVADLLDTVYNNWNEDRDNNRLQLTARCDNLPEEALDVIRTLCTEKGHVLLQEVLAQLSAYDRDQNTSVFGTGRKKAGLGMYYFESDVEGNFDETP